MKVTGTGQIILNLQGFKVRCPLISIRIYT